MNSQKSATIHVQVNLTGALTTRNGNRLTYEFYLLRDTTVATLACTMRKVLRLEAHEAIFLFCHSSLPSMTRTLSSLVPRDGRQRPLVFEIACENAFG